jgi:small subunit ribosomal protein S16
MLLLEVLIMVVIRLAPAGKKGEEVYRLVVADKDAPLGGKYLERVGLYRPKSKQQELVVEQERFDYWVSKGAKPSPRVLKVLRSASK